MDAQAYLTERAALVNRFLDDAVPGAEEPPARLHAAMRHLLFPGGKRLRPGLAFAACEALGGASARALPVAAAVELIHTYTLVHDDLPCMDDDPMRRGRPTVHVAFDEATAVLAGDALQALAFQVLARTEPASERDAVLAVLGELAGAAGSLQLVGGQSDDLAFVPGGPDEARRVEAVHRRKSGALIGAAVAGGARLAGADPDRVARLRRFGQQVGLAFQIADDLLDREQGDPCSLVRVLGAGAARERAETLLREALEDIEELGEPAEPLRELARYAVRRET